MALRYANRMMAFGLAGAMSLAVSGPSVAQEGEDVQEFEAFEVTGSRIKRVDYETAQPVISLTRDDIERSGLTSLGDLLQNLTIAGSGLNTTFNNGGTGSTEIDLRNLGSNRVLVLVNGRRWVRGAASLRDAVDLNTIPISIVQSIEVLKDGASAIYGSDAIAGVVNIKTVQDFTGAEFRSQIGQYDEGDGTIQTHSLTVGSSTGETSVIADFSYTNAEPVFASDREISFFPQFGTGTAFGSSGTPQGRFFFFGEAGSGNAAVNDLTVIDGADGRQRSDFRNFVTSGANADFFNFAPFNYLLTPNERASAYAQVSHSITDNISLTGEALYNNRQSSQLLAPTPLFIGSIAGSDIGVAEDNRFNPFGQELGVQNPGFLGRRMVEVGNRIFEQDVDTYRLGLGLTGDFLALGDRIFGWDVNYIFTESQNNAITGGLLNLANVRQGLGPDSACTAPCVPFNIFGGAGSITQAMVDFVTFTAQDEQTQRLESWSANLSVSNLVQLPAGSVGLAVGVERREESGRDTPDALIAAGLSSGNIRQPTGGDFALNEFYAEVDVPLLADLPGADYLAVSLAARSTNYDNLDDSVTTGQYRLEYRPVGDVLVRATFAESFRGPSISELFQGNSDSFPQVSDPCSDLDFDGSQPTIEANCAAQGVPTDGSYSQFNPQIESTVGGNPNLEPEEGESFTAGIVWNVGFVEGLSLLVDYFDYEVEGFITTFGVGNILNTCAQTGQLCNLITRQPTGDITDVLNTSQNLGRLITKGVDFGMEYDIPFFKDYGNFKFAWGLTYLDEYKNQLPDATTGEFVGENVAGENLGDFALPRVKSTTDLIWTKGNWGASWTVRYFGEQTEDCDPDFIEFGQCSDPTIRDDGNARNELDATVYNDVQAYYTFPGFQTTITAGIDNVFNEDPPVSVTAFANSFDASLYELPGLFPYVRLRVEF